MVQLTRWDAPNVDAMLCSIWSAPFKMAANRDNNIILSTVFIENQINVERIVAIFCLDPSTVMTSDWDVIYTKFLFYIHLEQGTSVI